MRGIEVIQGRLPELSGRRWLCHYTLYGRFYADELFRQYLPKYPEVYARGLSSDAPPPQEVALAIAWAGQGGRWLRGRGHFLRGCAALLDALGAGSAFDRRIWTFTARRARRLRTLPSRDVVFSEWHLEGRQARGGHLRRQEAEDGIASTLGCASFTVLPSLAGEPWCVRLGSIAAGLRIGVAIRLPRARGIQGRRGELHCKVKHEGLVCWTVTCRHWNRWQASDRLSRQSSSWIRF